MNRLLLAVLAAALAGGAHAQEKKTGQSLQNALAMCIGCHGIPGYKTAFPDVYHVPKIAGQQAGYIVNALKAYQSGERSHPSMRGIAASLTEEDMKKLADYYAGGQVIRFLAILVVLGFAIPAHAKDAAAGKAKAAQVCAACHGPDGNKPSDPTQPILAGQYYDYLVRALTDYKTGKRNNPIMKGFAGQLSKRDIQDLAAWFASQKSNLHDQR